MFQPKIMHYSLLIIHYSLIICVGRRRDISDPFCEAIPAKNYSSFIINYSLFIKYMCMLPPVQKEASPNGTYA